MRSGSFVVFLALFSCLVPGRGFASDQAAPFAVEVVDCVETVPTGLPTQCCVKVRNISGDNQAVVALELQQKFESWPEGIGEEFLPGGRNKFSYSEPQKIALHKGGNFQVSPDWVEVKLLPFFLPAPGEYSFRYVVHMPPTGWRVKKMFNAPEKHWIGDVSSKLITVRVREPEGIDAEAFRAVCTLKSARWSEPVPSGYSYRLSWFSIPPTGALTLLLTKYQDSTYAAYEIYKKYGEREWNVDLLDLYRREPNRMWHYTWCDTNGNPNRGEGQGMKLAGKDYFRCEKQWLQIALENHPEAWFADEIRLTLAGNAYVLGDKDQCRKILTDLAKQGRPYVAMKAGKLLRDMQAKNMLPGGPKELGAAPAQAQPEGTAAQ